MKTMATIEIKVVRTIPAPPGKVFDAWLNPNGKREHAPADGYVIEARQAFRNKLQ